MKHHLQTKILEHFLSQVNSQTLTYHPVSEPPTEPSHKINSSHNHTNSIEAYYGDKVTNDDNDKIFHVLQHTMNGMKLDITSNELHEELTIMKELGFSCLNVIKQKQTGKGGAPLTWLKISSIMFEQKLS
eukprot:506556-Ditylum_brightwellii.AAC.1